MQVSINWLNEYVNTKSFSPEQLGELITKSGVEVDGIHYIGEPLEDVVVGYVKSCKDHPNADTLHVCEVDIGTEDLQVVCGAPNVAKGQSVVVAKPGPVLPGDFEIKQVNPRELNSNGMICSCAELGIKEEFNQDDAKGG